MVRVKLEKTHGALERGHWLAGLTALLAAWRERRAVPIADAIVDLSSIIDRNLPPVAGRTQKDFQTAWLDMACDNLPISRGRLITALFKPPTKLIRERLERLLLDPADPRLTRALAEFVERREYSSTSTRPLWTMVFKTLDKADDPGVKTLLEKTRDTLALQLSEDSTAARGSFHAYLVDKLTRQIARLDDPPELLADEARLLAACGESIRRLREAGPLDEKTLLVPARQIDHSKPSRTAEAFLEEIFRAPDEDGPRLVFADWLTERGDPRGEFIALQYKRRDKGLTRKEGQREQSLLAENRAIWLGPIEPAVDGCLFERGFPAAATVRFKTKRQRQALLDLPHWRTLTTICCEDLEVLLSPSMSTIKRLSATSLSTFVELVQRTNTPPIEAVTLRVPHPLDKELARVMRRRRSCELPTLREVYLNEMQETHAAHNIPSEPASIAWFLAAPLARQLESLAIRRWWDGVPDVAAWLDGVIKCCPALRHLGLYFVHGCFDITLNRQESAARWSVRVSFGYDEMIQKHERRSSHHRELAKERFRQPLREAFHAMEGRVDDIEVLTPVSRLLEEELEVFEQALSWLGKVHLPPPRRVRAATGT